MSMSNTSFFVRMFGLATWHYTQKQGVLLFFVQNPLKSRFIHCYSCYMHDTTHKTAVSIVPWCDPTEVTPTKCRSYCNELQGSRKPRTFRCVVVDKVSFLDKTNNPAADCCMDWSQLDPMEIIPLFPVYYQAPLEKRWKTLDIRYNKI